MTYPTEMAWLKKQQRGREAKAAMPGAMMAAGGKIFSALGAATVGLPVPGHGAAGGTGGGGKPGVTASPLRGVPDGQNGRPVGISATDPVARRLWERANGQKPAPVTDGFVKHGAVGNTARTIIHAEQKGHLAAAARPALDRLEADANTRTPIFPGKHPDFKLEGAQAFEDFKALNRFREPVPSGVVPEGSPVVNDGPSGSPVVTRAPAVKRKVTRLSQYVL